MSTISRGRAAWQVAVDPERIRSFGQLLAAPRRRYCVHIPLLLLMTGLVTWTVETDTMLAIGSFIGGVVGFYMFFEWLFRGPTRFSTTLAIGLLAGYAGGCFNTWATTSRAGFTLGQFMGHDDAVLAQGIAAVLIACAVLILWGELFEKPIFGLDFVFHTTPRLNTLIIAGAAGVAVAFRMGALSFMGATSEGSHLGFAAGAAQWLFPPMVNVAVATFLVTPSKGMRKKILGICALALVLMLAVTGRRMLIYSCAITLFIARTAGYRLVGNIRRQILVLGTVAVLIVTCALGFMLLRVAGYNRGKKTVSLQERIEVASDWVKNGTAVTRALNSTQQNVQTRTFVLGFFAEVLNRSEQRKPGMGQDALAMLETAVPSAITPDKEGLPSEEEVANALYGFSYNDEANSILTAGAIDFGLFGIILYPILTAWCLRWGVEMVVGATRQVPALFFALACLFQALAAENTITAFAVTVLHGLLFVALLEVFFRLPRFQLWTAAQPEQG